MMVNDKEIIEKLNRDYLECVNSKEYRLGSGLFGVINGLKGGRFNEARENIRTLWQGVRIQKYNSKTERYREIRPEGDSGRIAVYAALFGSYDEICEPCVVDDKCDYYIFTDQETAADSCWQKIRLTPKEQEDVDRLTDTEKNRYFKMLGYRRFADYKYSIYIDINLEIYGDITGFTPYADNPSGLALYNHPARDCIYNEAKVCVILGKAKKQDVRRQMKKYSDEGMPRHYGMCECGVIARDNGNEKCLKIMEDWWREFKKSAVKRDQIVFPVVMWRNQVGLNELGCLGENIASDGKFRMKLHAVHNGR